MTAANMGNDALSPIVVIREKEMELAERLAAAKQGAERTLLEARQWATAYRDQAEREGQAEAAAFYRSELAAVDAKANQLRAEGERAATEIAERGRLALDRAVRQILETVLPVPISTSPAVGTISAPPRSYPAERETSVPRGGGGAES